MVSKSRTLASIVNFVYLYDVSSIFVTCGLKRALYSTSTIQTLNVQVHTRTHDHALLRDAPYNYQDWESFKFILPSKS
jgi:hypothetical protein